MGFSKQERVLGEQEQRSGLPCPPPGYLPTQGSNPGLPHCRQILYHLSHQGSPSNVHSSSVYNSQDVETTQMSIHRWLDKDVGDTVEYYFTIKKNEIVPLEEHGWTRDYYSEWSLRKTNIWYHLYAATAAAKSLQSCLTLRPLRRQPTRLPRPWDSPGKNTGVGCHFLLQCVKMKSECKWAFFWSLPLSPHACTCVCSFLLSPLTMTLVIGFRAHLNSGWIHLTIPTFMTSTKTFFQIRSHSQVPVGHTFGQEGASINRDCQAPSPEFACLTSCQVMLMLLVWETHTEDHCLRKKLHIRVTRCSDI